MPPAIAAAIGSFIIEAGLDAGSAAIISFGGFIASNATAIAIVSPAYDVPSQRRGSDGKVIVEESH